MLTPEGCSLNSFKVEGPNGTDTHRHLRESPRARPGRGWSAKKRCPTFEPQDAGSSMSSDSRAKLVSQPTAVLAHWSGEVNPD